MNIGICSRLLPGIALLPLFTDNRFCPNATANQGRAQVSVVHGWTFEICGNAMSRAESGLSGSVVAPVDERNWITSIGTDSYRGENSERIREALADGLSVRKAAAKFNVNRQGAE